MRGSTSKDLGRRAFGVAGGRKESCGAPEPPGEVIDLENESGKPAIPPVPRAWKPRAGCITHFLWEGDPDDRPERGA
ncbi:MAG: hypothetical protein NCA08_08290 [Deltaproteobacteria bacterium]|nr:hypothetical protein [Candidatus Deferrimicrobium borealis]